jgi:hypothetical protein
MRTPSIVRRARNNSLVELQCVRECYILMFVSAWLCGCIGLNSKNKRTGKGMYWEDTNLAMSGVKKSTKMTPGQLCCISLIHTLQDPHILCSQSAHVAAPPQFQILPHNMHTLQHGFHDPDHGKRSWMVASVCMQFASICICIHLHYSQTKDQQHYLISSC